MWDKRILVVLSLGLYACGGRGSESPSSPSDTPASTTGARSTTAPSAPTPAPQPLPGVDVSALGADEQREFYRIVEGVNSPCGEAMSIARCVREGGSCASCRPAARYAARLLGEGYPADGVRDLVRNRYARDTAVELSTEGCAFRGAAMARVTIFEFADFECPHCRQAHEAFDRLFADPEVAQTTRLCYRFFPLTGHENARPAARAAVAAMNQGKFWEMHDLLYDHQTELSPAKYLEFAARIGLDRARFSADLELPATDERVQRDRTEGERVEIEGTPAIFVNGRRYEASPDPDSLRAYIREELER